MAQSFFPLDEVDATPETANEWTDVDVSAYVPSGATGVILELVTTDAYAVGLRKKGSTDNRTNAIYPSHCWAAIGVDANRVFQAYIGSTTQVVIALCGYTMSGVTFFTNAYDKSISTVGAWTDIDCSAEAPNAIGLIFEVKEGSSVKYMGLRKNGSSDDRTSQTYNHSTFGAIIGCDESQVCEGYVSHTWVKFFLVGYITDGAVFNTNATDVSITKGGWKDLPALPAGANMGFIEVASPSDFLYGLNKKGAEGTYWNGYFHPWAFVACDDDGLIQGDISNNNVDFFLVGYATADHNIIVRLNSPYNSLVTNLGVGNSTNWGLELFMPTAVTNYTGEEMTGNVTLLVSEA